MTIDGPCRCAPEDNGFWDTFRTAQNPRVSRCQGSWGLSIIVVWCIVSSSSSLSSSSLSLFWWWCLFLVTCHVRSIPYCPSPIRNNSPISSLDGWIPLRYRGGLAGPWMSGYGNWHPSGMAATRDICRWFFAVGHTRMNWVVLHRFYFVPPKHGGGNDPVWRISYEWILTTTEWRILKWFQKMLIYPKIIGSFVFLFEVPHFFWRGSLNFTMFKDFPERTKRAWDWGFGVIHFMIPCLMSDFYQLGEPTYPEIFEVFWGTSWCLNTSP